MLLLALSCATIEASAPVDDPSAIRAAREVVSSDLKDGPSARWREEAAFAATARMSSPQSDVRWSPVVHVGGQPHRCPRGFIVSLSEGPGRILGYARNTMGLNQPYGVV